MMKYNPAQRDIIELVKKHREVFAVCGRGSGKTEVAMRLVMHYAMNTDPSWVVWVVTKSFKQARRIWYRRIVSKFPEYLTRHSEREGVICTRGGAMIELIGSEADPDALRGRNVKFCVMDEAFFTHRDFLHNVVRPSLRGVGRVLAIGTLPAINSDLDPAWFDEIDAAKAEDRYYVATSVVNQGYGLPNDYVSKELERARSSGIEDIVRRELLCEFPEREVLFRERIAELPIAEKPRGFKRICHVVAIDPHPVTDNAIAIAEIGSWFDEDSARGISRRPMTLITYVGYVAQPADNLLDFLRKWEKDSGRFTHRLIDPHMSKQENRFFGIKDIAEWFLRKRFFVKPGNGNADLFMQRMHELLQRRELRVLVPPCGELLRQLKKPFFDKVKGKYKKRSMKGIDLVDCLKYIVNAGFEQRLFTRHGIHHNPYTRVEMEVQ